MSEFCFYLGANVIWTRVHKVGFWQRGIGLMFSSRNTNNLLFEFSKSSRVAITSLFVFYPFLAAWLDEHNRVVDFAYVRPFSLSVKSRVPAKKLVELPLNDKNKHIFSIFRRKSGKI